MNLLKCREKCLYYLFFFGLFFLTAVFFTQINPLVIFDGDDWTYISYKRDLIPLWGNWNPCRILPEVLMRTCAELGVYLIYPFTNDYIGSITFTFGIVLSGFITVYAYRFSRFLMKKFSTPYYNNLVAVFIFFISHFWIFRRLEENNHHLFLSPDVTCVFYYTIPNLMGAAMVFYFAEKELFSFDTIRSRKSYFGIIFLLIYLTVFSNLYPSIILISYLSYVILADIFKAVRSRKFSAKNLLSKNAIPFIGIAVWGISLIYEYNGGRANGADDFQGSSAVDAAKYMVSYLSDHFSRIFLLFAFVVIIASAVMWIYNILKKRKNEFPWQYIIGFAYCFAVCLVYEVLLSAKVNSDYTVRTDVILPFMLYALAILSIAVVYLLKNKNIHLFVPVICTFIVFTTFQGGDTYVENLKNYNSSTSFRLDNYIVDTLRTADRKNLIETELHVPKYDNAINWPQQTDVGDIISDTLYRHGIIGKPLKVVIVPDEKINKKFGISGKGAVEKQPS